jgi:hypothetical protein
MLFPYGWAAPETKWPDHGKELIAVVKNVSKVVGCPVIGTNLVGQISYGPWFRQIYGGLSVVYDNITNTLIIGTDRERDVRVFTITMKTH